MRLIFLTAAVLSITACRSRGGFDAAADTSKQVPLMETMDSLPACDAASDGQAAYVVSEAALAICSSGEWAVQEKKSENAQAQDPATQQTIPPEPEKEAERVLGPNEWRDPMTGFVWLLTGFTGVCSNLDSPCPNRGDSDFLACAGDWRYPKGSELVKAMNDGLARSLPASQQFYWSSDGYIVGTYNGTIQALDYHPGYEPYAKTPSYTQIGLYCTERK